MSKLKAKEVFVGSRMSELRFWELVAQADWPNQGYDKPKLNYLKTLEPVEGRPFRKLVDGLWNVLDMFVGYGRKPFRWHDSYSDLLYHIIGLGKDEFYACLDDYKKMDGLDYKESFGYAVPYENDWDRTDVVIAEIEEEIARMAEKDKSVDKNLMMFDEVMQDISDCLKNADGKFIAEMHNKICDYEIEYCGDDVWKDKEEA